MRKFVFTLQSVLKFKQTTEKRQKADLANVMALLRKLYDEDMALDLAFQRTTESQELVLRRGINIAEELPRHAAYFLYIRDEKKALRKKIDAAELARERCQRALIKTMNEIKTLEKLKDEQYRLYLEEVRAEEDKAMADIISFNAVTAGN